jgi:hypothetical protein
MPAVLTSGSTTLTPRTLSDYSSENAGGSIVHAILGRREPDVTLRPVGLRTGSMTLDFATEALANTAHGALTIAAVWTLQHSERATVNMRFIVRRITRTVEADGRWFFTVGWEEIGS